MYLSLGLSFFRYPTSITWLGQFRHFIFTSVLSGDFGSHMHTHACVHTNIPDRKLADMHKYKLSSPGTWVLVTTRVSLSWLFSFTCSSIMSDCTSNSELASKATKFWRLLLTGTDLQRMGQVGNARPGQLNDRHLHSAFSHHLGQLPSISQAIPIHCLCSPSGDQKTRTSGLSWLGQLSSWCAPI